jgi:O-antigen ligase
MVLAMNPDSGYAGTNGLIIEIALFCAIILASIVGLTGIGNAFHAMTAVPAVLLFGTVAVVRDRRIYVSVFAMFAYCSIWLIYIFHSLYPSPSVFSLIRMLIFMTGSFILLFILPHTIGVHTFMKALFYIGFPIALLGLISVLLGEAHLFGLTVSTHHNVATIPLTRIKIFPAESIFSNPNSLGLFSCFASISGLAIYYNEKKLFQIPILLTVMISVFLSFSRSSIFVFCISLILITIYTTFGKKWVSYLTVLGLFLGGFFAISLVGVIPDYFEVQSLLSHSRPQIWNRAIHTLAENRLVGVGIQPLNQFIGTNNPHNTYIMVFVRRGLVGGVIYIIFLFYAIWNLIWRAENLVIVCLLTMMVSLLLVMNFESIPIYGFSIFPVILSIVVGFSIMPVGS